MMNNGSRLGLLPFISTLFAAIVLLLPTEAAAQAHLLAGSEEEKASSIETLLDAAQADGYQVILVPPQAPEKSEAGDGGNIITWTAILERRARAVREALVDVIASLPSFPAHVQDMIARNAKAHGVSPWWPVQAVALGLLFLLGGYGASRLFSRWIRAHFAYLFNPEPQSRSEKIAYLLLRVVIMSLTASVLAAATGLLIMALGPEAPPFRTTMVLMLVGTLLARITIIIFQSLIAPDAPSHRMMLIPDDSATALFGGFRIVVWLAAVVGVVCIQMDLLGIDRNAHNLMLIAASLFVAVLFATLAVRHRDAIGGAILGEQPDAAGMPLKLTARFWHIVAVAYFMGAWVVSATRLLLDLPGAIGLILNPLFALVVGFFGYAVMLLIIDRVFLRRGTMTLSDDEGMPGVPVRRRGFKELCEHAAGLVVVVGCFLIVLDGWTAASVSSSDRFGGLFEIVVVLFGGFFAYQSVKILIDERIALEEPDVGEEKQEDSGEGGGTGATRLATLLPIFRNFLLAVIVAIVAMVTLSELGVDIAPLFAGAGVVGLAVGFGAQTLIRDIFSGAFFLLDDAFRKGEYIDINGIRGTVEKISIRSMQLRHQLGLLHTVPFGEITSLTNYSRDWVMMKLPLRLTYDTDPEKVRKLVKKLGQELLEHPEIGEKFMEPLKSQGVYMMEDSAMIIRVKFMTKPGDQFVVRKTVYARIRELFEQNGIHFAHREVTVRIADQPDRPLSDAEKEAVTGAVRPVLDPPASAPKGPNPAEAL